MTQSPPISTAHLLTGLDSHLISFLRNIKISDWEKQTLAPKWKVKDVALHLLDGNLRSLSMLRDNHFEQTTEDLSTYKNLVTYLNTLNAEWIKATRRLSPKIIIELLENSGKEYCDYLQSLNPFDDAIFSVAWAGESTSKNWFHIAREYTEKWHHQQQIRSAISSDKLLLEKKWYYPYLSTSMRGLPFLYQNIKADHNDAIKISVGDDDSMHWFLYFKNDTWLLTESHIEDPTTIIKIKADVAWKVFTKGMTKELALEKSEISGDHFLGRNFFNLTAVMG